MNDTDRRLRVLHHIRWQGLRSTWQPVQELARARVPWLGVGFGLIGGFFMGRRARTGARGSWQKSGNSSNSSTPGDNPSTSQTAASSAQRPWRVMGLFLTLQRWSQFIMPLVRQYAADQAKAAPPATDPNKKPPTQDA